jgi:hypothetical protein
VADSLTYPDPAVLEKQFWTLIDKIDRFTDKHHLPAPHLRPILEQFSLIDSDKLRAVGKDVWGTGGEHQGIPATIAADVPEKVLELLDPLNNRWTGPAYTQFEGALKGVNGVVKGYPVPAQQVGQVLEDLAEKFDLTWIEIIGLVGSIASAVVAVGAMLVPEPVVTKVIGVVLGVIGWVLTCVSLVVSLISSTWPRMQAAKEAMELLGGDLKIPGPKDALILPPSHDKWKPVTANPND